MDSKYKIKLIGFWTPYTPDNPSPNLPPGSIYFKDENGQDFYQYMYGRTKGAMSYTEPGVLFATALKTPKGNIMQAIGWDLTKMIPPNSYLMEITGVPDDNTTPWKLFEQQELNADTLSIDPFPDPQITVIPGFKGKIQLSRIPHDGSVVPNAKNLLQATKALIDQANDEELEVWFSDAPTWSIDNPNLMKLASTFKLSAADVQAAFAAADKIQA